MRWEAICDDVRWGGKDASEHRYQIKVLLGIFGGWNFGFLEGRCVDGCGIAMQDEIEGHVRGVGRRSDSAVHKVLLMKTVPFSFRVQVH